MKSRNCDGRGHKSQIRGAPQDLFPNGTADKTGRIPKQVDKPVRLIRRFYGDCTRFQRARRRADESWEIRNVPEV